MRCSEKPDIIYVSETHLPVDGGAILEGYIWFGNNRSSQHKNAPTASGGVGIFVRSTLFDKFRVQVCESGYDGIIAVNMCHKITDYTILVFSVYLPPENSPYHMTSK